MCTYTQGCWTSSAMHGVRMLLKAATCKAVFWFLAMPAVHVAPTLLPSFLNACVRACKCPFKCHATAAFDGKTYHPRMLISAGAAATHSASSRELRQRRCHAHVSQP